MCLQISAVNLMSTILLPIKTTEFCSCLKQGVSVLKCCKNTVIAHICSQKKKRWRLGMTPSLSERSTSCSLPAELLQEASAWPPRLKPLSLLRIAPPSGERKLFTLTNIDPCIRDHRRTTGRNTHIHAHTYEEGGFLLYLGFSPWQKSSRRAR